MSESSDSSDDQSTMTRWPLLLVGFGLIAVVVFLLLMPIPFKGRTAVALGDLVHAPLFGSLTIAILALLQRLHPEPANGNGLITRCVLLGSAVFAFGVAMELMQHVSGRTGTVHDAISNGMGITAALLFFLAYQQKRRWPQHTWLRPILVVFALIAFTCAWLRPANMLADEIVLSRSFPILASFESKVEITRFYFRECSGSLSEENVTDGNHSMAVAYQGTESPSFTLTALRKDWSRIESLEMDITLDDSYPATEATFVVSVLDDHHADYTTDLFRRVWQIKPGETAHLSMNRDEIVEGPPTRSLDLTRIRFVDMLLNEPVMPTTVRIDNLKLKLQTP